MTRPIVIIGAGVLGSRIACVFLAGGHRVHLRDLSSDVLSTAGQFIDSHLNEFSEELSLSTTPGNYQLFTDLSQAVQDAWLVIEAIPERLPLKISTFAEIDRHAPKDCIIASNSSSFKSRLMLEEVSLARRERVLNMHFMMPPTIRAIELMTDGETLPEIFTQLTELLRGCGMIPVTARKESTGFIFNRIWAAVKREILFSLAEDVSSPAEIDIIWQEMFQRPTSLPPCRLMDQIGLDTVAYIEDNYIEERGLDASMTVDWLRKQYLSEGKLGLKSDNGGLYGPPEALYLLDVGLGDNVPLSAPISQAGRILRFDITTKEVKPIVIGQALPDGIGHSHATGRIFWTNMGASTSTHDGSVHSAKLDGSDLRMLIPSGAVHTPKQLTVDDKSRKVYFCDREGMAVHRCDFDGSDHEIIVRTGFLDNPQHKADMTRWCVGITLDIDAGYIYWTQKGPSKAGRGRIFRAGIELPAGQTSETRTDIQLVLDGLPEPIDLELDSKTQTLYWTDRGEHPAGCSLNALNLDGVTIPRAELLKSKKSILVRHFNEPIGLKLGRDGVIYVTDLGGSLYSVKGGQKTVLLRDTGCYTGIAM